MWLSASYEYIYASLKLKVSDNECVVYIRPQSLIKQMLKVCQNTNFQVKWDIPWTAKIFSGLFLDQDLLRG